MAKTFRYANNFLYLGRGFNFPVALEGALKLKVEREGGGLCMCFIPSTSRARTTSTALATHASHTWNSSVVQTFVLQEISYIHAEGYPAAEMKHGPIALIDKFMPVVRAKSYLLSIAHQYSYGMPHSAAVNCVPQHLAYSLLRAMPH